ncbi:efflux RND transporter periplasmic adaptor subunit [Xanthobacter sp. TB0139]|uniref:efflux RND transporter periplasmic adaptor subunit n=1 Tax=Xanthobacter sp. TB0139 TaxID=3459178 RepID=UPI0040392354
MRCPASNSPSQSPPDHTSGATRLVATLALVTLLGGTLAACGEDNTTAEHDAPARPVQVATVHLSPRHAEKSFVGVIRARREIDLAFRVGGKMVQRHVEVGDHVTSGAVIARIDPEDLRLELESAHAELAAAEANLSQTSAEDQRYRALRAKGVASAAELDRKSLAMQEAVGRLERAKRSLELAENRLSYADLVSDADGIVVAVAAEPGQVVSTGQTIVRVARLDEKEALVALPETALNAARKADAMVTLWAAPDQRITARLRELSPQADPASRTYPARFTLDHAGDTVALGMTATVTLVPREGAPVARVPLSAVFDKGHGAHVFIVEPGNQSLTARPVIVAGYTQNSALLSSGLREGEKVVTLGVHMLKDGQQVRTVPAKGEEASMQATPSPSATPQVMTDAPASAQEDAR